MTSRRTLLLALAASLAVGFGAAGRAGADPQNRYRLHVSGMT